MKLNRRLIYLRYWLAQQVVKSIIPLRFKIRVRGRKNIPRKGPFLVVSNHRYDLDAFLLMRVIDAPVTWVAADFLAMIGFIRPILWVFGMITVSTQQRSSVANIRRIVETLADGGNIGIFPEGMDYLIKARFKDPMTDFYKGFSKIAVMLDIPVYPVAIVPKQELQRPYPIPKSIRRLFTLSPELQELSLRNTYRSVEIRFGEPIRPRHGSCKRDSAEQMQRAVRDSMEAMMKDGMD